VLAGQGALSARDEVTQLADLLAAPVAKALLGKAVLRDDSPFTTGGIGDLGTAPSSWAMQNCDTVLILGSTLTHWLFSCGHFRISIDQGGTMSDGAIPGGKIRTFVERIENLDTEIQELNEQKKEVFAKAKGDGFDVTILKEIVKLRKQDEEERDERESMLDLYMRAMEQAGPKKVAKAA